MLADPLENCPRYNKLFWNYLNSTEGKMLFENHTELIKYLEHHTGSPMYSKAFADLYFSLTTEASGDLYFFWTSFSIVLKGKTNTKKKQFFY